MPAMNNAVGQTSIWWVGGKMAKLPVIRGINVQTLGRRFLPQWSEAADF